MLLVLTLVLMISAVHFVAADVVINPSTPDDGNALVAYVEGEESTTFDFYWKKGDATYFTSTGTSSTLGSSYTDAGDTWTVYAFVPASAWFDTFEHSKDSVTIEGTAPNLTGGLAVIDPANPTTDDMLEGYIQGYEGTVFDFYWTKGDATYHTSTGTSSTLQSSYTSPGEVWTLSVWVPSSAWFDSFELDSVSVTIADESGVEEYGDAVIIPEEPCEDEALTAYIQGWESTTFDFYWQRGATTYYTETGTSSTLASSYTSEGQTWTVYAWVPASAYFDSFEISSASVTIGGACPVIQDCDNNTAPVLDAIANIEVLEGETVNIVASATDVDGDALTYTFSGIAGSQNANTWTWNTEDGDAGIYTVDVTVEDECEEEVSTSLTVTVLDDDSQTSQPRAVGAKADAIYEGELVDFKVQYEDTYAGYLKGVVSNMFSQSTTIYVYDADSTEAELTYTYTGPLDTNGDWQTQVGDAGKYSSDFTVNDEEGNSKTVSLTISVLADDNICPVVTAEDIEADEEDLVQAVYTVNDQDGDNLVLSWSSPLDANGEWQTQVGDAGVHTMTLTVSDGTCDVEERFTVTILNEFGEAYRVSDYEGDKLDVKKVEVLNANTLYSAYDVSDLDIITNGVFHIEDDYLYSSGSDNEIKVLIELYNKNSFDAKDLQVTFVLEGKETLASFQDLDRSEKASALYTVKIPNGLETGKHPLLVIVENDDLYNLEGVNLDIISLGEYVGYDTLEVAQKQSGDDTSFLDSVKNFFGSLF